MKRLLVGIALVALITLASAFYVTRNVAVTHPVLATSELPPLIPTRAFYADPRTQLGFIASADGAYTVSQKASLTGRNMVVTEVATGREISEFPVGLNGVRWHPSEPKLRFIFEGQDWEVDPFDPARENWVRTSPVELSGGWALNEYAADPDKPVLFWGRSNSSEPGHLWLVSQDGLDATRIAEGTARTIYWVIDYRLQPVLRVDARTPSSQTVLRKIGDTWEDLFVLDLDNTFEPLGKVDANGKLLVRSSRGRDKAALVEFDVETADEKVLLAHPTGDIGRTTALTYSAQPDVIRMGFDTQDRVALTDRGQVFLDILSEFPQPITLGFTSPTASGRFVTQAVSPQSKSWIYLLIDLQEGSYTVLDEFHFRRFKDRLVQEQAVTFQARDGLEIPAILTLPENATGPIPFVVYVHGGPASFVSLGYGHGTQFLVNRGYGVLSVNFRGSAGFGKDFQAKGFGEFGRAMQDDITDAAMWLVAEGLADPDALAVMGRSYGGYSAALAMTRDPDLFDAAIVEFPMLDVEFQSKHHPGFWNNGIDSWWRYFGKTQNPDDLEMMRKYSPINRVSELHGPLLVMAGIRDQVTSVQQVRGFQAAVEKAGKDAEFHYFADAGHGVDHWRDELTRGRLIEDFLAVHLGGRSGGFEFVETAPQFID